MVANKHCCPPTCLQEPGWRVGPAPPCRGSPRCRGRSGAPVCAADRRYPWPGQGVTIRAGPQSFHNHEEGLLIMFSRSYSIVS